MLKELVYYADGQLLTSYLIHSVTDMLPLLIEQVETPLNPLSVKGAVKDGIQRSWLMQ
ncbi:MAG: hypothetical protein QXU87_02940 [Candidatus Caldarchaeum sp.]